MTDSDVDQTPIFEVERIRHLVELMKEFDLREVDLRQGEQRIRLCRGTEMTQVAFANPMVTTSAVPPAANTATGAAPVASKPAADGPNITYIKSPMVGTFYSRPNPKAAPFIKVGDHVEADRTVCIIEAMKVFNEIPAEVRGKIVAILVNEEEPVEFGRPLFKVDTSG